MYYIYFTYNNLFEESLLIDPLWRQVHVTQNSITVVNKAQERV